VVVGSAFALCIDDVAVVGVAAADVVDIELLV